jgi:hypothetical protein
MELDHYTANTIITERTRYQLEHFVIGQHDTPQMQWRQILLEAQQLAFNIRMAELDIERKRIEAHKLLSTGDPLDAIEAEEKQIGIILTERTLAGARMEMSWLEELATTTGSYTTEEIESNQPEYWQLRLTRQADVEIYASQHSISAGNTQSMLNAGLLKQEMPCAITPGN